MHKVKRMADKPTDGESNSQTISLCPANESHQATAKWKVSQSEPAELSRCANTSSVISVICHYTNVCAKSKRKNNCVQQRHSPTMDTCAYIYAMLRKKQMNSANV